MKRPECSTEEQDEFDACIERAKRLRAASVRGRYAPSPTGALHLGNLRTALAAWLHTRLLDGTLILRMEDTDLPRVKQGSAASILADLAWLGLDWDEGGGKHGDVGPYSQQARDAFYRVALTRLNEKGLVYPCACSRKDVAQAASAPHGKTPIYPGTCRRRGDTLQRAERKQRRVALRLKVDNRSVTIDDAVAGRVAQELSTDVGDYVLWRSDGLVSYQLAVAVDDGLMGVTHVVRGRDLLDSSPRQLDLIRLLGLAEPEYWHVPLLLDGDGRRMSKRDGSCALNTYIDRGMSAKQILGMLAASLGLVEAGACISARDLLAEIDLERLRQACIHNRAQGALD